MPEDVYQKDKEYYDKHVEAMQQMLNRMSVSFYKYGTVKSSRDKGCDFLGLARQRTAMYDSTGIDKVSLCNCGASPGRPHFFCFSTDLGRHDTHNTENLLDAANYDIMETIYPVHADAFFKAQESKETPHAHTVKVKE